MKILFITYNRPHYGLDLLYSGLVKALGSENVIDFPTKETLHSQQSLNELKNYPCYFSFPKVYENDTAIFNDIKAGKFDRILLACDSNNSCIDLLSAKNKTALLKVINNIPSYIVDMGDLPALNRFMYNMVKPVYYFKREYGLDKRNNYPDNVIPLSFSIAEENIHNFGNDKSAIALNYSEDTFWSGHNRDGRDSWIRLFETVTKRPTFSGQLDNSIFKEKIKNAKVSLNLLGHGNDTVRYYEIPANLSLLFTQELMIKVNNAFINDKECCVFNHMDMEARLKECLTNQDYHDTLVWSAYEKLKTYHTDRKRAEELLNYLEVKGQN